MELLYYNELKVRQVEKNYKKVIEFLKNDNFKSADIKKMQNTGFYRAKLDDTNRLLFKFARFNDKTYILILEVILNHEYEKSKFLRGSEIDENKITAINNVSEIDNEDVKELPFVNKKHKHFYMLDKILSFDDFQEDIYQSTTPVVIIGSAGSGKTVLTLEKLKQLHGNIAYISLSPYLVENAEKVYYANNYNNDNQEVEFLSFREYMDSLKKISKSEINFKIFERWFYKHFTNTKIKEPFKIFEEFKGVLTGSVIDKAYLSLNEYLNLGIKQSIILKQDKQEVYEIFEKYLDFLNQTNYFDVNILSHEYLSYTKQQYDYVVVDEVQDITNIQLKLILNSLKTPNNFILSGDSNQIVHPNFFSWSKIKSMFYLDNLQGPVTRILTTNYRNSKEITELSNLLLKIKNIRFGSIDKESTYLIDSISTINGNVELYHEDKKIKKELNQKTQNSAKFAVLVMNNEHKAKVKQFFKTPLVFSIHEAKGLEYENIILVNFLSNYQDEFYEITKGVDADILDDELKYSRAKNKEDKDLEVYKFFINSLYVAFTRAIKNIYIIENNSKHKLLELLKLKKSEKKLSIENQKSSEKDWLEEAQKLEKQGKYEQAQQIRDRISGIDYISPEEYKELKIKALDKTKTEKEVKRERKDLFKYAVARKQTDDIQQLADLNFHRAIVFMKEYKKIQKEYIKNLRNKKIESITNPTRQFGIDFRCSENEMTGLMYSALTGSEKLIDYFIQNNASIKLTDSNGIIPLQHLLNYYYSNLKVLVEENQKLASISHKKHTYKAKFDKARETGIKLSRLITKYYPLLQPSAYRCSVDDRIIKIGKHTMEYNLINAIKVLSFIDNTRHSTAFSISDFVDYFMFMHNAVLADYRKKRSYINSILANNEVDRVFIYNKKLFKRVSKGVYSLNPELEILLEEIQDI